MAMRLPDFIGIGQMRAGTTSLHQYLSQHPSIFMPKLKELRYFNHSLSDPERENQVPKGLPRTLEEYARHFQAAPPGSIVGEFSPQYIDSEFAARQISETLGKIKLICCLRNPVDRLYSLYQLNARAGRKQPDFPVWFAQSKNEWGVQMVFTFNSLRRYYDIFGYENIHITLFDELVQQPSSVMSQVFSFLKVDPSFLITTSVNKNESGVARNAMLARLLSRTRSRLKAIQAERSIVPSRVWSLGKTLAKRNLEAPERMEDSMRNSLIEYFYSDVQSVGELIQKDLSHWLRSRPK